MDATAFASSQRYGRDKARFSFVSGIIRQLLDSALIHYGVYATAWTLAGKATAHFGYGPEYEVRSYCVTANSRSEVAPQCL